MIRGLHTTCLMKCLSEKLIILCLPSTVFLLMCPSLDYPVDPSRSKFSLSRNRDLVYRFGTPKILGAYHETPCHLLQIQNLSWDDTAYAPNDLRKFDSILVTSRRVNVLKLG